MVTFDSLTRNRHQVRRPPATTRAEDRFGRAIAAGNFNGFQGDDLVVGLPGLDVTAFGATNTNAGGVEIYSGGQWGPEPIGVQTGRLITQASPDMLDNPNRGDAFGRSLVAGDFNGDGKDDLVVGVNENLGVLADAGAVQVVYGSNRGLTAAGNQLWHKDTQGVKGEARAQDYFGSKLAVGDFNGDGYADLVASTRGSDFGNPNTVSVLHGSAQGLTADNNQIWRQGQNGLKGEEVVKDASIGVAFGDRFGSALATGDFNGDGKDDLAIGDPLEMINNKGEAGAVNVLYGSDTGLTANNSQFWHQDVKGMQSLTQQTSTWFGYSLAAADFNGDGKDDLAVGIPLAIVGGREEAGAVGVLYGSKYGLTAAGNQVFTQNSPGMDNTTAELGDMFGSVLAAGDFNGDGYADLAIGVPEESIGIARSAGAVDILYGSAAGLTTANTQTWHQNLVEVEGYATEDANFGHSLTVGDFNNDGYADLAIGLEKNFGVGGAVAILFGSAQGLTSELTLNAQIGTANSDFIYGTDRAAILYGGAGSDVIYGGAGDDILIGGEGDDILVGEDGDDIFYGGPGQNTFIGGDGADVFVIANRPRAHIDVLDFTPGVDRLGLLPGVSFDNLAIARAGTSTTISFGSAVFATLRDTNADVITANDFVRVDLTSLMGMNDVPFVVA
jgi:Ca2+-binding RTX toxin-like protein